MEVAISGGVLHFAKNYHKITVLTMHWAEYISSATIFSLMAVSFLASERKNERKSLVLKNSVNITPQERKQCLGITQITLTVC